MNLQNFWEMGGYAWYVWPAYGITLLVLLFNLAWPIVQRKQFIRQQRIKQKRAHNS